VSTSQGGGPLAVLRRVAANRPAPPQGERCELCGVAIGGEHAHVVNVEQRSLLCTCRPCYLLFTDRTAALRFRAVPERYLSFPEFELGPGEWDELEIPVGLVFFFRHSGLGRMVAFYPGPAGATESELPVTAWEAVLAANPQLATLEPDVEGLLVRAPDRERADFDCFLVPVDKCYELVGQLRQVWRGFDGGQDARARIEAFLAGLRARCRPAPPTPGGSR
jgi:hypothetical protein